VDSTISIERGDSLIIEAGVLVQFNAPITFYVYGTLLALGSEGDSVCFWSDDTVPWNGIQFYEATHCSLSYISIRRPLQGLRFDKSQAIIEHSTINAEFIGVLADSSDNLLLVNSNIEVNGPAPIGVKMIYASMFMANDSVIVNSNPDANPAMGLEITKSNPEIRYCVVDVMADIFGYGIRANEVSIKSTIHYNLIRTVSKSFAYGGHFTKFSAWFVNNTVVVQSDLFHGGCCLFLQRYCEPWIENCILYGDGSSYGIQSADSHPVVLFSDIYHHDLLFAGVTPGLGCISDDPQFENSVAQNYHLLPASPCIDAGDPNMSPDPDLSVRDMGCYFYDQTVGVEPPPPALPRNHRLIEAFPNPFNAATRIAVTLPVGQEGELRIYDLHGRLLETLFAGFLPAGSSRHIWDASRYCSGIYWVVLDSPQHYQTVKVCLVR